MAKNNKNQTENQTENPLICRKCGFNGLSGHIPPTECEHDFPFTDGLKAVKLSLKRANLMTIAQQAPMNPIDEDREAEEPFKPNWPK